MRCDAPVGRIGLTPPASDAGWIIGVSILAFAETLICLKQTTSLSRFDRYARDSAVICGAADGPPRGHPALPVPRETCR